MCHTCLRLSCFTQVSNMCKPMTYIYLLILKCTMASIATFIDNILKIWKSLITPHTMYMKMFHVATCLNQPLKPIINSIHLLSCLFLKTIIYVNTIGLLKNPLLYLKFLGKVNSPNTSLTLHTPIPIFKLEHILMHKYRTLTLTFFPQYKKWKW